VIEVKYGLASVSQFRSQMRRYIREMVKDFNEIADDMTKLVSQKRELNLFGQYSRQMHNLEVG